MCVNSEFHFLLRQICLNHLTIYPGVGSIGMCFDGVQSLKGKTKENVV